MKHGLKKRILSLVLCISMVLPMAAVPMPVYSVENEESIAPLTNPFTPETIIRLPDDTTTKSQSYRIPSMVTLADGTIVAAADIRWNTTYDGGGLDTLVARSTDDGQTWSYTVANYLGDNGNAYNAQSTTFIDPNLLVAADGQTVYMLVDLYAYGIALNGSGSQIMPVADTGFDANGNLKLSNNSHSSYDYYLKDGKIYDYSNNVVEGYEVDAYFNVTYTQNGETSNLFYSDSPFKVARTQYLYLTKSTDGGATWSEPDLLDVRAKAKVAATENALLVSPGNSITTSDGIMVYPAYSFIDSDHQSLALIYSVDGVNWERSTDYTALNWSSEGSIVELQNGNLRVFVRNRTGYLCYVDFDMDTKSWITHTQTTLPTNSNTQLSAITYSKTFNGQQVILVSCPTGPNEAGSDNNNGKYRTNGKIFVGVVAADGTMSWPKSIDVGPYKATTQLQDPNYTEDQGFFAYSCLTERSDGSVAILYENNQFDWGASGSNGDGTYDPGKVTTYYTITGKSYSRDNLGLPFDDEKVIDRTATIRDGVTSVTLYADPSDSSGAAIDVNTDILPEIMAISGMYYDDASGILFYRVRAAVGFSWPEAYDAYAYIPADAVDLRTDYGIAIPIVDFTNAAPLVRSASIPQPATYKLRSSARTLSLSKAASNTPSGLVLDKTVTDNGNGTYTVNLEAYTTGTVTVQQATKPMDIVLVLDQSGSMAYCIGCGKEITRNNQTHDTYSYSATYNVRSNGTYYIKNGDSYSQVYHCDGSSWSGCAAGWYTQSHGSYYGHGGNSISYKRSLDSEGIQFYTRTVSGEEACESRLEALKRAVRSFVDEVYKKAAGADGVNGTTDDVAHRIAIVGFASQSGHGYNTELLSISGSNSGSVGIRYNNITTANYTDVLQNLTVSGSKTMLDNAINALAAQGATEADLGMLMAENIYKNNAVDLTQRDRVTIMFTDGTPTTGSSYESTVANDAIKAAYSLKNTYGSTVYTVGVFDGANASSPGNLPSNNNTGSNQENRYMHLVSSNYLNATSMTTTGTLNPKVTGDNGYYLSASDSTALNDIFQAMSSQIGSTSMDLGTQTVVKDIVTPQFDLPAGVSSVVVKQVDCLTFDDSTGVATWGTETALSSADTVQIDFSTNSVSVTGFDFKHNYVASNGRDENDATQTGDFHGRKLVITFVITPDPDFLGGDNVETNGTASGVYDKDGTCVGTFVNPQVNVPLKDIDTVAQDKHIYYGNTTDLTGILNLHVKESTSGKYLQDIANGINNAYVDLVYTVTLNDQTVVTYTIPAGTTWNNGTWKKADGTEIDMSKVIIDTDTPYGIVCTMTSKNNPGNHETAKNSATIYVYRPELTFKDATKTPLEDKVAYNTDNYIPESTVWKHGNTLSSDVTMEGNAPELTLTYYPAANCVGGSDQVVTYDDFYVDVKVAIGGTDITDAVTFVHKACDPACSFNAKNGKFMIHVVKVMTSLTIQKAGYSEYENVDPNQTFLFRVEGDGVNLIVTVHGNSSATINGLKVGSKYTVTELTDWSWRYEFAEWAFVSNDAAEANGNTNSASFMLRTDGNTLTFTNTRDENKWLDGDSWLDNLFKEK